MARGKGITANPQFQVQWRDVTRISVDLVTGMTEGEAAKAARAERPLLVFVHDPDAKDADENDRAFQDERVAVGARFFECLRIGKADALEDRLLSSAAQRAPVLLLLRPNYEVVSVQPSRFNANRIFDAMCGTMKKDYKNCVQTVLKKQREIEKERMSLQREKDKLARMEEEAGREAQRTRLAKLKDQILASEAALGAREEALYRLEPRGDEKVS